MACIYRIRNLVNGKIYIGSTQKIAIRRKEEHFCELVGGYHYNKHLQNSFDKHGKASFTFEVLEEVDLPEILNKKERYKALLEREIFYIQSLKPQYNICTEVRGGKLGRIVSEETKKKLSLCNLGKKRSEDTKKRIRLARSKQIITQEHKDKISISMRKFKNKH